MARCRAKGAPVEPKQEKPKVKRVEIVNRERKTRRVFERNPNTRNSQGKSGHEVQKRVKGRKSTGMTRDRRK